MQALDRASSHLVELGTRLITSFVLVPIVIGIVAASAWTQSLSVTAGSSQTLSSCIVDREAHIAGSRTLIQVTIDTQGSDVPLSRYNLTDSTLWEQIRIEAGIYENARFETSGIHLEILNPVREIGNYHVWADSIYRVTGVDSLLPAGPLLRLNYFVTVPEDLVGRDICFRASYHADNGSIVLSNGYDQPEFNLNNCIHVAPVCSDSERARVLGTHVYEEMVLGDYEATMRVADSLIAIGWRDLNGLFAARVAAERAESYERAVEYLDICFETYRRIVPLDIGGSGQAMEQKYVLAKRDYIAKAATQR